MKHLSRLKKKLRSSDSANECSAQPTPVPAGASTSQITTPSGHQASGYSLTPQIVSSPLEEPENNTPSIPERLWSKAYDILEEKEPDVVKGYQEILERVQNEWVDTAAPEELQNLEHCKSVKSRQMWRLVYSGLERSKRQAKVKESVSNIMETIDNLKGVVDKAIKYSSEASIAWAGVSLGLEILSNPMKEPGLNRKGIAYVLSRMEWYWNLAELVLQDISSVSSAALRTNLETQIIEFYKKLLLFQMRSVCLYYRNWAGVILRDVIKLDDWSGELNSIKDAENLMRNEIEQYDNQDIRLKLSTIETSALKQAESLEFICLILREEARLKDKNKQDEKDKDCLAALLITDPRMDKKRIQSQKGDPLRESYEWILKSDAYQTFMDDASSRVLWVNGPPGKGKTMLLCGIIDELQKSLRSISFFLCQANVKEEDLSSDTAVMRGLIYVLLEHQPSLIYVIRRSYDQQKDRLFNSINSSELLGDILTTMLQDSCLQDTILLVDALDECNINRTKLTNLIVNLSKSCNTKWIISSRDWPEIRQELVGATGLMSLDLEQEHESVSEAVKAYIRKKVDDLAKTKWKNDLELKEKVFDYMQSHADGTFLWVALVCERLANSGIRKRLVMEELMKFPTSLTALYQVMMNRITDSSEADRLKQILALVCVVYRPIKSDEIPALVEPMSGYDEDDVKDAIASCGSFLILQDKEIFFVHQSAKEFLLDQGHEVLFPHGINHKHAHIFSRSIKAMESTLRQNIYELGSPGTSTWYPLPEPDPLSSVEYSCVYWAQHLSQSEFTSGTSLSNLQRALNFLQLRFTCWLEALRLKGELSTAITSIGNVPMPELTAFARDARRFIAHRKPAIDIAPLQVYCSALIFCPKNSVIRQRFSHQIPHWITVKPEIDDNWDAHVQTIHIDSCADHASYSSDGRYLACSNERISQIYDTASEVKADRCFFLQEGNNIAIVFEEHVTILDWETGERIFSFSLDNRSSDVALLSASLIITVSTDAPEVRIWDLLTGDCKNNLYWSGQEIQSLAFSLDGHRIAAASTYNIRLWDFDDTQSWAHKHDLSHGCPVGCITFSADSRMLISGSYDNFIRIWDETGVCVKMLKRHTQYITCLAVNQMQNQLASGSEDGTIKLWDLSHVLPDQFTQKRLQLVQTHDDSSQVSESTSYSDKDLLIDDLLFSPTGKLLASISAKKTHIWDTARDICTDTIIYGGASGPDGVSFTPDDRLVAMGDANGKLGVWNTGLMAQIYFSDLEKPECVSLSPDGRYVSSILRLNTSRPILLKIWDLIEDAQGQQHITSEILPLERIEGHNTFVHSQDWNILAIYNSFEGMGVLQRQSGHWVNIISPDSTRSLQETPLVFTPDSEWLITYKEDSSCFLIQDLTFPYVKKYLGPLDDHAFPYDIPKPEELCWRITTPYGILGVDEPSDFKGTRRIGWGLSIDKDWIMRGTERLLWIPTDYRRMALDVNASRVAFVCPSGQIQIMKFQ
ncbi:hypothetical protein FPRO04_10298 [Fusarium proliferatum]|nr:hypothetical protein FPRO04_10298 [Fusarium proliferatum]